MQKTMDETERRREKQIAYNYKHGLSPQALNKRTNAIMKQTKVADGSLERNYDEFSAPSDLAADPVMKYMSKSQVEKSIRKCRKEMEKAAKELNFVLAASLRDELFKLEQLLKEKKQV